MTTKRKIILISIIISLLIGSGFVFALTRPNPNVRDGVNYSPPTDADKALNNSIKQNVKGADAPSSKKTSDGLKEAVTPVISAWGQPEGPGKDFALNGYVPSVVEVGGSCSVSLKKGSEIVSNTSGAVVNAQSTSCSQITIPITDLSIGTWEAILTYTSKDYEGSSSPTEVTVR